MAVVGFVVLTGCATTDSGTTASEPANSQAQSVAEGGQATPGVQEPAAEAGGLPGVRALLDAGKTEEAEQALREMIAGEPADGVAQLWLGYLLAGRGMLGEAEQAFRKVLELKPDQLGEISARLGLAAVIEKQGRQAEADEEYARALALDPSLKETLKEVQAQRLMPQAVPVGEAPPAK